MWRKSSEEKSVTNTYFAPVEPVHRSTNCSYYHFDVSFRVRVALAPCSGYESCHTQWEASKWDRSIHAMNPLRCRPTDIHEIRSLYQRHQHRATFRRHPPTSPNHLWVDSQHSLALGSSALRLPITTICLFARLIPACNLIQYKISLIQIDSNSLERVNWSTWNKWTLISFFSYIFWWNEISTLFC